MTSSADAKQRNRVVTVAADVCAELLLRKFQHLMTLIGEVEEMVWSHENCLPYENRNEDLKTLFRCLCRGNLEVFLFTFFLFHND